ncbi:MAG: zinc ribbon domain-containing protein [Actinomycetota bacterium]|nr:zinc ribbon domain-containing protein [Actinomycetota bacterium]
MLERELEIRKMDRQLSSETNQCPACGKLVNDDFLICPHCRKKLKNSCINCSRPLELDWKVCPYCKISQ